MVAHSATATDAEGERPNVVLIMSDDQGYGDFGATGNRVFETPHIDAMAARSASMDTFYVCPVCSPTRACLMTGRYNYRTRCIDTYQGRSMLDPAEVTIAEVLGGAGYATGIFGKWHLGDSYPLRAIDQGFEQALIHKGGGLAQWSDPLDNQRRYTDAILFKNGEPVHTRGFCTDVYFSAALEFIEQSRAADRNFFVYLPTNAPHGPFHDIPADLFAHYRDKDFSPLELEDATGNRQPADADTLARIGAMITNIDQNVGRLFDHLDQLQLTENTIVIYMVDNGPNTPRYVGPFRGHKSTVYEGGVRSPFWMHWPARLTAGSRSAVPAAHIDVMPTLLDACGVEPPDNAALDGRSFLPLLCGEQVDWPERYLAIQSHRGNVPVRYHQFMIRDNRWKLVHPSGFSNEALDGPPRFELYDLTSDPGERNDLAAIHPAEVQRLKAAYDAWFADVSGTRPDNYAPPRIVVGNEHENPTILTRQDWRVAEKGGVGVWEIHVAAAGVFDVTLLFDQPVTSGAVELTIGGASQSRAIEAGATSCTFNGLVLDGGNATVKAVTTGGTDVRGAYHVTIERK
ncbi:MAG: arylsulfatase [Planctomycetaceae bacterium]